MNNTTHPISFHTGAVPAKNAFVIIYRKSQAGKNKILLQMRSASNIHGASRLGLPGGKRDNKDGGSTLNTAIRETKEETQIALKKSQLRFIFQNRGDADIYGAAVPTAQFHIGGPEKRFKREINSEYGYNGHAWIEYTFVRDTDGNDKINLILKNGEKPWRRLIETLNNPRVVAYLKNPN